MNPRKRYMIIGAGAAGMAAAETIRKRDPRGEILLVSEEVEGYYSRPGLAYVLTGELNEKMLFPFSQADFQRLNIQQVHARAEQILPSQRQVRLGNGSVLEYDRLLIATGSRAAKVNMPNSEIEGWLSWTTWPILGKYWDWCVKRVQQWSSAAGLPPWKLWKDWRREG